MKQVLKDKSEFTSILNRLENEQSLMEYLRENTIPAEGTWDDWADWWINDWVNSESNELSGKDFYNWLMINYK
jgi:hypothetical protein